MKILITVQVRVNRLYNGTMNWVTEIEKIPREETDLLAVKAKAGDEKALNKLLKHFEPIIHLKTIQSDYSKRYIDEMMQVGLLIIPSTLKIWDNTKAPFDRLFDLIINRQFKTFIHRMFYTIKRQATYSIDEIISEDYDKNTFYGLREEMTSTKHFERYVWNDLVKEIDSRAKMQLTLSQYILFKMYYYDCMPYQDIKNLNVGIDNVLYGKQKSLFEGFLEEIKEEII